MEIPYATTQVAMRYARHGTVAEQPVTVPRGPVLPFGDDEPAIARLASTLNHMGGTEFQIRHLFAPGLYVREVLIPAGSLLISHIHRHQHIVTCSSGAIAVFQPPVGVRLIRAPFTFVSAPGSQRVGIAIEDTVWGSYHATDLTHIPDIEAAIYDVRPFPEYVEGDIELLRAWLRVIEHRLAYTLASGDETLRFIEPAEAGVSAEPPTRPGARDVTIDPSWVNRMEVSP